MEINDASSRFAALGHPGRLAVFRLLARRAPQGVAAGEVARALDLLPNTLSAYLGALTRAGLIRQTRQGRSLLYSIELSAVGALSGFLTHDCCQGRPELCNSASLPDKDDILMTRDDPFKVLFLCTANSARSLFAEALLRDLAPGRFIAFSAGTSPATAPHPEALALLAQKGHDTAALQPKGAEALVDETFDFVFTVCDTAANEVCAPLEGQPLTAHWGQPDPVQATGTEAERALAFQRAYATLKHRLSAFTALPVETLDRLSLQHQLDAIGTLSEED